MCSHTSNSSGNHPQSQWWSKLRSACVREGNSRIGDYDDVMLISAKKYSIGPYNTKWWQRFHQPLLMDSFAYMPSIPPIYFSSIRIWDNRFTSIKLNRHLRDRCPGLKPRPRLKQRMLMHCAILAWKIGSVLSMDFEEWDWNFWVCFR